MNYQKLGLLPYQIAWIEDGSPIKIYEKSRRIGITYAQALEDVIDAGLYGRYDVWFTSNNEGNGREYIRYCKRFAKALEAVIIKGGGREMADHQDQLAHSITFKNGKRITALTSNPDQLHGKGGKIILDEFARRENELETWEAAAPAARVWNYPIRIISTHRGKGSLFYSFIQRQKRGEFPAALHRATFIEAVHQGLADKAGKGLAGGVLQRALTFEERNAYIEQVRKESGSALIWKQQYLCEPVDENETFLPYSILDAAAKAILKPFEELAQCGTLYAGLDVGRFHNLSVLWIAEQIDHMLITRHIRAIREADFPRQERIVGSYLKEFGNLRRLCIDRTGMGIGLTDYLQKAYGKSRVEGVHFTAASKEAMAFQLRKRLEDVALLIPDDERVKTDLNSVQRATTASGNIRLVAETQEDGSHADYFWAAALMVEASQNNRFVKPEAFASSGFSLPSFLRGWARLQ